MPRDATDTRQKILDAAHDVVMRRGFASTSVDAIQEEAGISRGTFFYHFPSKDDLARELIERHARADKELTDDLMRRAEKLARDPLQQMLVFVGLYEELFETMEGWNPGCLFASYSYEAGLFDEKTLRVIGESIDYWRGVVGGKLEEAFERHPPAVPTEARVVADLAYGIMEGAFILARVKGDRALVVEHVRQFRTYLELLCGVVEPAAVPAESSTG